MQLYFFSPTDHHGLLFN